MIHTPKKSHLYRSFGLLQDYVDLGHIIFVTVLEFGLQVHRLSCNGHLLSCFGYSGERFIA